MPLREWLFPVTPSIYFADAWLDHLSKMSREPLLKLVENFLELTFGATSDRQVANSVFRLAACPLADDD
jgi:hypothetical protein